jgi:hypothetical protein
MKIRETPAKDLQINFKSRTLMGHENSMRRFFIFVIGAAALAIGLNGCGAQYNSGTTPPPTPSAHTVTLQWAPSSSVVSGYYVYRGTTSGGPYMQLGLTQSGTTQYTDKTVQNSQTYYYVVTAFDANRNESAYSTETSATIPAT